MTTQLSFSVLEDTDDGTDKLIQYSTFSRDWAEEVGLDELIDSLNAGRISHNQCLLRAQKLLHKFPGQMEIKSLSPICSGGLSYVTNPLKYAKRPTGRLLPSSRSASKPDFMGGRLTTGLSCASPTAICWV